MKVATCTPVPFEGNSRFFTRDSGLLCRGFQSIGVDCFAILPGEPSPMDEVDLLRCKFDQLKSAEWWKSQNLDLVVLYAWGDPKYASIAKSIREAGILLIQNLDTSGMHSPYTGFKKWSIAAYNSLMIPSGFRCFMLQLGRIFRSFIPALFDTKRLNMMAECDLLAAVSPPAKESISRYLRGFNRKDVANKLVVIPHSVSPVMVYRNEVKYNKVIAVGRWGSYDQAQKDPQLTIQVLVNFLREYPDWDAEVIGNNAAGLAVYLEQTPISIRDRLKLTDQLDHAALRNIYAQSQILFCGSRHESFHIASAEAVCFGCSIVCANTPLLASTAWFTSYHSGTLAMSRKKYDLLLALRNEALAWNNGQRNPAEISSHWLPVLSASAVAKNVMSLVN